MKEVQSLNFRWSPKRYACSFPMISLPMFLHKHPFPMPTFFAILYFSFLHCKQALEKKNQKTSTQFYSILEKLVIKSYGGVFVMFS